MLRCDIDDKRILSAAILSATESKTMLNMSLMVNVVAEDDADDPIWCCLEINHI